MRRIDEGGGGGLAAGRIRGKPFTIAACIVLAAVFVVGLAATWFGGDTIQHIVANARAMEVWARGLGIVAAIGYFLIIAATLLLAIPIGNVLLFVASYLIGMPMALGAHVLAILVVAPIHYTLANLGIAGPLQRWAEALIEERKSKIGSAVFTAARRDGIATSIVLRLGLGVPNAVVNVMAALLGISLLSYLIGSALVVWMRPTIIAWLGSSLATLESAADVTTAIAQATALAVPLVIIPLGVTVWLARRYIPRVQR
jgi:uncharacterized membrane protein YdjX (TVP38/TMEM64 family)